MTGYSDTHLDRLISRKKESGREKDLLDIKELMK